MIPEKTEQVSSEDECTEKNPQQLATSEGEKLEATEDIWYDQPKGNRRRTTTEEEKPLSRPKRFQKSGMQAGWTSWKKRTSSMKKRINEKQPNFGSGLKPV